MSFLLVVRHTRAEEETGRTELVRRGRRRRDGAPLAAALLVVAGAADVGVAVIARSG